MRLIEPAYMVLLLATVEAVQYTEHHGVLRRDGTGTLVRRQATGPGLMKQLYYRPPNVKPEFTNNLPLARAIATRIRDSPEICHAHGKNRCYIGACDESTGLGLYVCSWRDEGVRVTCNVLGQIATEILDKFESDYEGLIVADSGETSEEVQAYSFWSEDTTWATMFTMPCLPTEQYPPPPPAK
ncbi:hypothetical protein ABW19_dt0205039 [Dactylella cylindrospora]|nr:hypothetical protein ABW19_dt0205039 [Dactylella cylindrospora]